MEAPTLETERLTLRPFADSDVDALVREILSDPEVLATLPENPGSPEEQLECAKKEYIDGFSDPWTSDDYGGWAVCSRGSELAAPGTLLGFCGFTPGQIEGKGAELTYGYGKSHWGKGVGSEAAKACVDWYFREAGHDCVHACHYQGNASSKRIIEGLGLLYMGDLDIWNSVKDGRGLMPTYSLRRADYLNSHG